MTLNIRINLKIHKYIINEEKLTDEELGSTALRSIIALRASCRIRAYGLPPLAR